VSDAAAEPSAGGDEPGAGRITRARALLLVAFAVAVTLALYLFVPRLAGLDETWQRIKQGSPAWLALAFGFELLSFGGYILLFRTVFADTADRIGWRASYEISMGGVVATRLLAAGGAGGIAFTAWALTRFGLGAREVAARMTAFLVLLYAVFMAALVVDGLGLWLGLIPGPAPFGLTVGAAILGGSAIVIALAMSATPRDLPARARESISEERPRLATVLKWLATVPATMGRGVRGAMRLARREPLRSLGGAIAWWGFDIATLWACFHAFGGTPAAGVIVLAYFVGMLGNLLPLPGGIGGVEGGMIGAFAAFGVNGGLALVAVLAYRGFAFWLPMVPGLIAYLTLRRTIRREGEATPSPAS